MIVTCPNCKTKFNLPEEAARPGAKLRCSVCKFVFNLPESAVPPPQEDSGPDLSDLVDANTERKREKKKRGSYKGLILALVFLLFAAGGIYALLVYTPVVEKIQALLTPEEKINPADLVRHIALRGVRQYNVNNEKSGNISVIEGKAVNGFPDSRELIRIEAALYDAGGNMLVSKQQLAGTSVSLFQLRVLGEQELEQALANKIDILTNNTNVQPAAEVPFMVVFYAPPDRATEFGVKVIDARIPPARPGAK